MLETTLKPPYQALTSDRCLKLAQRLNDAYTAAKETGFFIRPTNLVAVNGRTYMDEFFFPFDDVYEFDDDFYNKSYHRTELGQCLVRIGGTGNPEFLAKIAVAMGYSEQDTHLVEPLRGTVSPIIVTSATRYTVPNVGIGPVLGRLRRVDETSMSSSLPH